MIEAQNLTKRYGRFVALNDLSFRVEQGEIAGFLGPNGAGKTTTMRILTGFMPPTTGRCMVAGFDVREKPEAVKRRVGYLPETPPLYPEMTVEAYLDFVAAIKGVAASERASKVRSAMERTNCAERAGKRIATLSKGYRQRVGLAQAIVHEPDVLILDEPTSGLDPAQIAEVRDFIRELRGKFTVLISSHILPEISATVDRVLILNHGRLIASDTPQTLARRLAGTEIVHLALSGPTPDDARKTLGEIQGVRAVDSIVELNGRLEVTLRSADESVHPRLARAIHERGWQLFKMHSQQMSLEQAFLELTRKPEAGS